MRLATVEQSRQIDRASEEEYALSGELLMEAAGSGAAREIEQSFFPELSRGEVALVCGPGNNGADGLVVARHLHSAGFRDLCIFLLAPITKRSPLLIRQLDRAQKQGITIVDVQEEPAALERLRSAALIVDALFGIGLRAAILDPFLRTIELMNSVSVPRVSLDSPSGLDCDRGAVLGVAVKATMTITFGLAKPGFFVGEGPSRVGRLRVLPIGFPYGLLRRVATTHFAFTERLARRYLPRRKDTSNKSQHGHLLVLAGKTGTWGAGILAASSAFRMGAGYVTLAGAGEPLEILADHPEIMTAKISPDLIINPKYKALAIGCGLGVGSDTAELIDRVREAGLGAVVVDADGLTSAAEADLFPFPSSWVITPHAGELSRILKVEAKTIESDRYRYALEASRVCGCHVLLKGFRSVLAYQDRAMVIMSGNSALAKAGTGDVLTGMVGSLLAQGLPPLQATATASYIHGRMADEWIRAGLDHRALTAGDLRAELPGLLKRLATGIMP